LLLLEYDPDISPGAGRCDAIDVLLDAKKILGPEEAAKGILKFVAEQGIQVLNVTGPRLSGWAEGHAFAVAVGEESSRGACHRRKREAIGSQTRRFGD
jgi:hypothetical protein